MSGDANDFASLPVDDLEADQPRESRADEFLKRAEQEYKHRNLEREQAFGQRRVLFRTIIVLISCAVGAVVALGALMLFVDPKVGDPVLIAIVSGLTVQSFTLTAIVARALYPSRTGKNEQDSAKVE